MHDYASYLNNRQASTRRGVSVSRDIDWWLEKLGSGLGKGVFLVIFVIFFLVMMSLFKLTQSNQAFPLKSIVLKGDTLITTPEDIKQALSPASKLSFFQINLDEVSAAIEDLSWIEKASIVRQWPLALEVTIVEHQAVMRWGDKELVDAAGNRFANIDNSIFGELPKIVAPDGHESEIIKAYLTYTRLFEHHADIGMKQFVLNQYLSWELHLDNGIVVKFGRDNYEARVKRFISAYQAGKIPSMKKIDVIDFRYSQGFAVKWKADALPKSESESLIKVSETRI